MAQQDEKKQQARQLAKQSLMTKAQQAQESTTLAQGFDIIGVSSFMKEQKKIREKEQKIDEIMQDVLENNDPETDIKDDLTEDFVELRESYITADTPKDKNNIETSVQKKVEGTLKLIETKDDLAAMYLDEMEYNADDFVYEQLADLQSGNVVTDINDDGTVTLRFPDESGKHFSEISLSEFKKDLEKKVIDRDSQKSLTALIDDVIDVTDQNKDIDETLEFDSKKYYNKINQIINNPNASLYSLANHKLVNGNSFKDHFIEAIKKGTYEDLGITMQELESLDPTPKTRVTNKDAQKIVNTLINNEDVWAVKQVSAVDQKIQVKQACRQ